MEDLITYEGVWSYVFFSYGKFYLGRDFNNGWCRNNDSFCNKSLAKDVRGYTDALRSAAGG